MLRTLALQDRKELEVSFFQAVVLLLFNSADSMVFTDIKAATNIGTHVVALVRAHVCLLTLTHPPLHVRLQRGFAEDGELRRTLQSLALGRARVLRKQPMSKDVFDTDEFSFNREFKAPLVRIKINTIQVKETKAEVDETHEKVMQDRQYQVRSVHASHMSHACLSRCSSRSASCRACTPIRVCARVRLRTWCAD
ncbi:hypothetical protein EON66_05950 [archaeon]|nr:MAG: hypothetical protein EON66_05950 [archaeon]